MTLKIVKINVSYHRMSSYHLITAHLRRDANYLAVRGKIFRKMSRKSNFMTALKVSYSQMMSC